MSAERIAKVKSAPYFTTYTEVDVEVDPSELERAGWRYVGTSGEDGKEPLADEQVIDIVMAWHDENHGDPWRWCQHALCDVVRGRDPR